jgi:hypothetical protein
MGKTRYARIGKQNYVAAMTFEEIAAREGITMKGCFMAYASGMAKLRRRRAAFRHLLELHHALDANRVGVGDGEAA